MPRKPNILNIKAHLNNEVELFYFFERFGDCPLFREELKKQSFMARAILRKHEKKNTRKDIYMEA